MREHALMMGHQRHGEYRPWLGGAWVYPGR